MLTKGKTRWHVEGFLCCGDYTQYTRFGCEEKIYSGPEIIRYACFIDFKEVFVLFLNFYDVLYGELIGIWHLFYCYRIYVFNLLSRHHFSLSSRGDFLSLLVFLFIFHSFVHSSCFLSFFSISSFFFFGEIFITLDVLYLKRCGLARDTRVFRFWWTTYASWVWFSVRMGLKNTGKFVCGLW